MVVFCPASRAVDSVAETVVGDLRLASGSGVAVVPVARRSMVEREGALEAVLATGVLIEFDWVEATVERLRDSTLAAVSVLPAGTAVDVLDLRASLDAVRVSLDFTVGRKAASDSPPFSM